MHEDLCAAATVLGRVEGPHYTYIFKYLRIQTHSKVK